MIFSDHTGTAPGSHKFIISFIQVYFLSCLTRVYCLTLTFRGERESASTAMQRLNWKVKLRGRLRNKCILTFNFSCVTAQVSLLLDYFGNVTESSDPNNWFNKVSKIMASQKYHKFSLKLWTDLPCNNRMNRGKLFWWIRRGYKHSIMHWLTKQPLAVLEHPADVLWYVSCSHD